MRSWQLFVSKQPKSVLGGLLIQLRLVSYQKLATLLASSRFLKRALPRHSKRSMMLCQLPRSQVESISFIYMLLELHRLYQRLSMLPLPNVALQNSRDL